jgi:hypothetical protein
VVPKEQGEEKGGGIKYPEIAKRWLGDSNRPPSAFGFGRNYFNVRKRGGMNCRTSLKVSPVCSKGPKVLEIAVGDARVDSDSELRPDRRSHPVIWRPWSALELVVLTRFEAFTAHRPPS